MIYKREMEYLKNFKLRHGKSLENSHPNLSSSTLHSLVTFCLDNSYFNFDGDFYSQDSGRFVGHHQ